MPRSRGILPEGAPAELFGFLKSHPGSTIEHAIDALQLSRTTAYYALTRLHDLHLIEICSKRLPRRWRIKEKRNGPDAQELPAVTSASRAKKESEPDEAHSHLGTIPDGQPRDVPPASKSPSRDSAQYPVAPGPVVIASGAPIARPTGTPYLVIEGRIRTSFPCQVENIAIAGTKAPERAPHAGRVNVTQPDHPWSYSTQVRGRSA